MPGLIDFVSGVKNCSQKMLEKEGLKGMFGFGDFCRVEKDQQFVNVDRSCLLFSGDKMMTKQKNRHEKIVSIALMRAQGYTLKEIANRMGYKHHSTISKIIASSIEYNRYYYSFKSQQKEAVEIRTDRNVIVEFTRGELYAVTNLIESVDMSLLKKHDQIYISNVLEKIADCIKIANKKRVGFVKKEVLDFDL